MVYIKWWLPNQVSTFFYTLRSKANLCAHISPQRLNAVVSWSCFCTLMAASLFSCLSVHMCLLCRFLTFDFSIRFIRHICSHHCFLGTSNTQLNPKVYLMNETGGKYLNSSYVISTSASQESNGLYQYFNNVYINLTSDKIGESHFISHYWLHWGYQELSIIHITIWSIDCYAHFKL